MAKDLDIRPMSRAELEDEVMLLRAQVRVLRNWVQLHANWLNRQAEAEDIELAKQYSSCGVGCSDAPIE